MRINYRLSQEYPFPTPVHDVLTGYDWILKNLVPTFSASTSPYGRVSVPFVRLGVCGELIGGTLATMLALTECKLGSSRIVAAAVNNPILDWAFPEELSGPEKEINLELEDKPLFESGRDLVSWWNQEGLREGESNPKRRRHATASIPSPSWNVNAENNLLPISTLLRARKVFFRKPEDYFDRFASPICFFRSPGAAMVYALDEHLRAASSPSEPATTPGLFSEFAEDPLEKTVPLNEQSPRRSDSRTLTRCRTYYRTHPSSHSKMVLPHMRITAGAQSPLLDQATEFARRYKRAVARQGITTRYTEDRHRIHRQDKDDKKEAPEEAERKVNLSVQQGVCFWNGESGEEGWRDRVEDAGRWFSERMR